MKISLDTNILHQEGFTSQHMQILARLADAGLVTLHMADLVLREHDSKRVLDTSSKIQSISQNLKDIKKNYLKSGAPTDKIEKIESLLNDINNEAQEVITGTTASWLKLLKVSKLEFSIDLYQQLWDDYFIGCGAFKKPKNRDDIPDAIIGLCITTAAKEEKMVVICKDGQLKGHLASTENLQMYDDLASFIASSEVQNSLKKLDSLSKNIETIKDIIAGAHFQERVFSYIAAHQSDLYYSCWKDEEIENTDLLPIPLYGGIRIDGPLVETITKVQFGTVTCIEPKHFVIPLEFSANMPICFAGSYLDWIHLPAHDKELIDFDSMDGDGIGEASLTREARVTGQVAIYFLEPMTADSIQAHAEFIGHDNCKLDIEYIPGKLYLI